jgi:hypothetical protein
MLINRLDCQSKHSHVHTADSGLFCTLMSILLAVEMDTPCMCILMVERDTPFMSTLPAVQRDTYTSILLALEMDTPSMSMLLVIEGINPEHLYCWRWKGVHPACLQMAEDVNILVILGLNYIRMAKDEKDLVFFKGLMF